MLKDVGVKRDEVLGFKKYDPNERVEISMKKYYVTDPKTGDKVSIIDLISGIRDEALERLSSLESQINNFKNVTDNNDTISDIMLTYVSMTRMSFIGYFNNSMNNSYASTDDIYTIFDTSMSIIDQVESQVSDQLVSNKVV